MILDVSGKKRYKTTILLPAWRDYGKSMKHGEDKANSFLGCDTV
jgi:hypothetical protein